MSVLPSYRARQGCMGGCLSDDLQSGFLRCLHHTDLPGTGGGETECCLSSAGGGTGCFQFLSTLHRMRPVLDQTHHSAGFHVPPFGKQELPFLLLRPRLSLCRSATFNMSQSREAPKQKLLTERTEPRCGREKRPPRPHIAAGLTAKAVASAAAFRGVKVNAVEMGRY